MRRIHTIKLYAAVVFLSVVWLSAGFERPKSVVAQRPIVEHVVINELESNPPGPDDGNQWVELYNPTSTAVDISNWQLRNLRNQIYGFDSRTVLPAKGFLVVVLRDLKLDNDREGIILLNNRYEPVDETPIIQDLADDDRTWQRFPNGWDTDNPEDWIFKTQTRGFSNGRKDTSVIANLSAQSTVVDEIIMISGRISPPLSVSLTIETATDSSFALALSSKSSEDGQFTGSLSVRKAGSYKVRAVWPGDEFFNGASSTVMTLTVSRRPSSLTLSVEGSEIRTGSPIIIRGIINPTLQDAEIVVLYGNPNGTIHRRSTRTLSNGSYSDSLVVESTGRWNVSASWNGDERLGAAASDAIFIVVSARPLEPSGVGIIAVALGASAPIVAIAMVVALGKHKINSRPSLRRVRLTSQPAARPPRQTTPFRPLLVANGALCPLCFSPMSYIPFRPSWRCDRCLREFPTV